MGSPHRRTFLDLRRSSQEVLALELQNHRYDVVMVDVDDVRGVLEMIREAGERDSTALDTSAAGRRLS
jgi:hypothetical protein